MPSRLVQSPDSALSNLCREHHKIFSVECMHNVGGHIDHKMEELPYHLKNIYDREAIKKHTKDLHSEKKSEKMLQLSTTIHLDSM